MYFLGLYTWQSGDLVVISKQRRRFTEEWADLLSKSLSLIQQHKEIKKDWKEQMVKR